MIFASLFALSDEIHQSFIPNRFADFGDWAADFIGIGLSLLLTGVVIKIFKRL
jgi:VanZ family protein